MSVTVCSSKQAALKAMGARRCLELGMLWQAAKRMFPAIRTFTHLPVACSHKQNRSIRIKAVRRIQSMISLTSSCGLMGSKTKAAKVLGLQPSPETHFSYDTVRSYAS